MRTFLFNFPKLLFFIALLQLKTVAQTTLAAGDIAFTGYIGRGENTGDDSFSFVLLKAVTASTVIKFTDFGYRPESNQLNNGSNTSTESEATLTTTTALAIGTEIKIGNLSATLKNGSSAGTLVFTTGTLFQSPFSLNGINGDQVFIYQGTLAAPVFITGIHWNVYRTSNMDPTNTTDADWDGALNSFASGAYVNANTSGKPAALNSPITSIWIRSTTDAGDPEKGNGIFNCTTAGVDLSTVSGARASLLNIANWTLNDNQPPTTPTGFTLPTGCSYVTNVAAVFTTQPVASSSCASLSGSFNATTDQSGVTFQWQEAATVGFASPTNIIAGGLYSVSSTTNSSTLTISDNTTKNGKFYRCVGTNSGALVTNSSIVGLTATVNPFPASGTNLSATAPIGAGNSSYFFASGCRLLGKVVPGNLTGNLTFESWVEATVPNVASVPFVQRHFQISPTAGTTGTVTLYFSQTDFNNYNAANSSTLDNLPTGPADATGKANFRLTKYNGSSNDFSGLPASYTNGSSIIDPVDSDIVWNATANRWEVTFAVNGFSGFTAQSAVQAPLPVKLVNFTSKINAENQAQLNWKVAEQSDIQAYEIEKSNDAKDFLTIGKVEANKATVIDYKFIDVGPFVGKNYYRLKIFEMNGETNFSKVVSLTFQPEITTNLYPNPSADFLKIDQVGDFVNQSAEILDSRGKLVKSFKLKKDENISIKELSAGIYFIKLASGKSIKFIKN